MTIGKMSATADWIRGDVAPVRKDSVVDLGQFPLVCDLLTNSLKYKFELQVHISSSDHFTKSNRVQRQRHHLH
jgi:hypothetical protein